MDSSSQKESQKKSDSSQKKKTKKLNRGHYEKFLKSKGWVDPNLASVAETTTLLKNFFKKLSELSKQHDFEENAERTQSILHKKYEQTSKRFKKSMECVKIVNKALCEVTAENWISLAKEMEEMFNARKEQVCEETTKLAEKHESWKIEDLYDRLYDQLDAIHKKIKDLEKKEEALSDEEAWGKESNYLRQCEYKKQAVKIYSRIQKLNHETCSLNRARDKKIKLEKIQLLNNPEFKNLQQVLEAFINSEEDLPDIDDYKDLINRWRDKHLNREPDNKSIQKLTGKALIAVASQVLREATEKWSKRRKKDFAEDFLTEVSQPKDQELEKKLNENKKRCRYMDKPVKSVNELLNEFMVKQEAQDIGFDEIDLEDNEEDEEDQESKSSVSSNEFGHLIAECESEVEFDKDDELFDENKPSTSALPPGIPKPDTPMEESSDEWSGPEDDGKEAVPEEESSDEWSSPENNENSSNNEKNSSLQIPSTSASNGFLIKAEPDARNQRSPQENNKNNSSAGLQQGPKSGIKEEHGYQKQPLASTPHENLVVKEEHVHVKKKRRVQLVSRPLSDSEKSSDEEIKEVKSSTAKKSRDPSILDELEESSDDTPLDSLFGEEEKEKVMSKAEKLTAEYKAQKAIHETTKAEYEAQVAAYEARKKEREAMKKEREAKKARKAARLANPSILDCLETQSSSECPPSSSTADEMMPSTSRALKPSEDIPKNISKEIIKLVLLGEKFKETKKKKQQPIDPIVIDSDSDDGYKAEPEASPQKKKRTATPSKEKQKKGDDNCQILITSSDEDEPPPLEASTNKAKRARALDSPKTFEANIAKKKKVISPPRPVITPPPEEVMDHLLGKPESQERPTEEVEDEFSRMAVQNESIRVIQGNARESKTDRFVQREPPRFSPENSLRQPPLTSKNVFSKSPQKLRNSVIMVNSKVARLSISPSEARVTSKRPASPPQREPPARRPVAKSESKKRNEKKEYEVISLLDSD